MSRLVERMSILALLRSILRALRAGHGARTEGSACINSASRTARQHPAPRHLDGACAWVPRGVQTSAAELPLAIAIAPCRSQSRRTNTTGVGTPVASSLSARIPTAGASPRNGVPGAGGGPSARTPRWQRPAPSSSATMALSLSEARTSYGVHAFPGGAHKYSHCFELLSVRQPTDARDSSGASVTQ